MGRMGRQDKCQNSGRKRESLIGSESSLITDLNSLQGRKNSLFGMRRELTSKPLIQCRVLLSFTRRRAPWLLQRRVCCEPDFLDQGAENFAEPVAGRNSELETKPW